MTPITKLCLVASPQVIMKFDANRALTLDRCRKNGAPREIELPAFWFVAVAAPRIEHLAKAS